MVRLTRIYTRTGDAGSTRLADNSVAAKTDLRVEAYGDVDEANSVIGVALAAGNLPAEVATALARVQNELFDVGADLSTPLDPAPAYPPLRITQDYIDRLEAWCDHFGDPLPALTSFVLPGGLPAAAQLHVARTVVRRAERAAWSAVELYGTEPRAAATGRQPEDAAVAEDTAAESSGSDPASGGQLLGAGTAGGLNLLAITYLNRLSDLLFILTRVVNGAEHEPLWVPGSGRQDGPPRARSGQVTGKSGTGESGTGKSGTGETGTGETGTGETA